MLTLLLLEGARAGGICRLNVMPSVPSQLKLDAAAGWVDLSLQEEGEFWLNCKEVEASHFLCFIPFSIRPLLGKGDGSDFLDAWSDPFKVQVDFQVSIGPGLGGEFLEMDVQTSIDQLGSLEWSQGTMTKLSLRSFKYGEPLAQTVFIDSQDLEVSVTCLNRSKK